MKTKYIILSAAICILWGCSKNETPPDTKPGGNQPPTYVMSDILGLYKGEYEQAIVNHIYVKGYDDHYDTLKMVYPSQFLEVFSTGNNTWSVTYTHVNITNNYIFNGITLSIDSTYEGRPVSRKIKFIPEADSMYMSDVQILPNLNNNDTNFVITTNYLKLRAKR